jgi:uncharacterized protein (TIGR02145 family)
MRYIILTGFMIIAFTNIRAQNYLIDFAGKGVSTKVDSVKIENLSQCTSLTISGSDILNLSSETNIIESTIENSNGLKVFPNPSSGNFSIEFKLKSGNLAHFILYDLSGKEVIQQSQFLQEGNNRIFLGGIQRGIFYLKIETGHILYTTKLLSLAENSNKVSLICNELSNANYEVETKIPKETFTVIGMHFKPGDTLKLTGKSGYYRTVSMLFPKQSQTVTFNFIDCTDADSNHYAVVQIGSQTWMAENLKTTKYRDGSDIPNVKDSATWGSTKSGAYCNFRNLPEEGEYYGRLYNFYAVSDSRNISPIGWHVATNDEWNIMEKFIDETVDTTALGGTGTKIGRILKEGCSTRWQYYDSTSGWNSAGFTALCSNFRNSSGAWSLAPNDNHDDGFWTSTPYNKNMAWGKSFRWCFPDIYNIFNFSGAGQSVRCVKDN